jgi:hypothetical protein
LDFICYLHAGWEPLIRPAEASRDWMDATPEAFAYRCLPLNIANAHGWEILSPCDATAYWTGGAKVEDVLIRPTQGEGEPPVSLFGQGMLTFHIPALFRTPPGWDLWVGGSPNQLKPGIAPLTGIVETDWSPYSFTMNWRFTRRNNWVSFKRGEPICFVFPVQRNALERLTPRFVRLDEDSPLAEEFRLWSESRNEFHKTMADGRPRSPAEKWQKRYYRGVGMRSDTPAPQHRTKIRLKPFTHDAPPAPAAPGPEGVASAEEQRLASLLASVARAVADGGDADAVERVLAATGLSHAAARRLAVEVARLLAAPADARPDDPQ